MFLKDLISLLPIRMTGSDDQHHLRVLDSVLQNLSEAGLKFRRENCVLITDSVQQLGNKLDKEGLRPMDKTLSSIQDAPVLQTVLPGVTQLLSSIIAKYTVSTVCLTTEGYSLNLD